MAELDDLLADPTLTSLLDLASAASGGAAIALTDPDGRVLAGREVATAGLTLPVRFDERTIGHVVGDVVMPSDLTTLVRCSLEMAIRGARDQVARAHAAEELAIGRQIQRSLLPRRFPEVAGWRFAADYEPAREIGGDLYDVFLVQPRQEEVALVIADVTGKGVPAALLMADTRALLHAATDNASGPADALERVNRILIEERRIGLFVTAALAQVEIATGDVRLASAGHEAPLVIHDDGRIQTIEARGSILGAFGDSRFEDATCHLEPGSTVVFYTDGITEARDEAGAFYGEDRFRRVLGGLAGASADDVRRAVVDDVRAFRGDAEPFDDLTLLVAERLA